MADAEHVGVVRKGAKAIDTWRRHHPNERLDLRGATLRGLDLHEARLSGALFSGADLTASNLSQAHLRNTEFVTAKLDRCDLTGADLSEADLSNASLQQAVLATAILNQAKLSHANLDRADLLRADIIAADLTRASLRRTDLSEAHLAGSEMYGADLHRANLTGANLSRIHLGAVNLSRANLTQTNLFEVDFARVAFAFTSLAHCDLSQCAGLETAEHRFPSDIGRATLAQTLRGAGGAFTSEQRAFFTGAGIPNALLDIFPSLVAQDPLQFYVTLLLHAPADEKHAQRLATELAARGVRSWPYEEAIVVGRARGASAQRAVAVYDKLIAVCSAEGLSYPPLSRELDRALAKEDLLRDQNATDSQIIYPVVRDDYFSTAWHDPRKGVLSSRAIHDLRSEATYSAAVDRLIEDLRASA